MKKITFLFILIFQVFFLCAQNADNEKLIKFIKGNISEKTSAVREASGSESILLALKAIDFSLENKDILGNDRELEGLAVAAVLSISPDYIKNANDSQKAIIVSQFINLFNKFSASNTVAIATLTKYSSLFEYLQDRQFVETLNFFLKSQEIKKIDESVMKSVLNTLQLIGNSDTFLILYDIFDDKAYAHIKNEIENTLVSLAFISQNEIIGLLETADIKDLSQIFKIIKKNSKISKNYVCDVSEKVISKSILLLGSSSFVPQDDILVQLEALNNLSDNKWTRASLTAVSYFQFAKKIYNQNLMTENQFESVINCLCNVSPVDAVNPLTAYLEELNRQKENETDVSSAIVLSVIKTLGAIGDKSAFDSLLAVTYLDYDESILSAARKALSGLRW
ncbi:MAG: HEAT repeat domain-containing protein [Spirochaetales bacterium]|nr:HEAT repeat domain-containing protein [Spirochaetales bacterium]MDY5915749.1 HEAT repeat domain-containing protein [Treponema sp.]